MSDSFEMSAASENAVGSGPRPGGVEPPSARHTAGPTESSADVQRVRRKVRGRAITGIALALGSMLLLGIMVWAALWVDTSGMRRAPIIAVVVALVPAGVGAGFSIAALLQAWRLPRGTRGSSLAWSIVATVVSAYVCLTLVVNLISGIVAAATGG